MQETRKSQPPMELSLLAGLLDLSQALVSIYLRIINRLRADVRFRILS